MSYQCGYCAEKFSCQGDLSQHCCDENHWFCAQTFNVLCPLGCGEVKQGEVHNIQNHLDVHHPGLCRHCAMPISEEDVRGFAPNSPRRRMHEACWLFLEREKEQSEEFNLNLFCGHCSAGPFENRECLAQHCIDHFQLKKKHKRCPRCIGQPVVYHFYDHMWDQHPLVCSWCLRECLYAPKHRECEKWFMDSVPEKKKRKHSPPLEHPSSSPPSQPLEHPSSSPPSQPLEHPSSSPPSQPSADENVSASSVDL